MGTKFEVDENGELITGTVPLLRLDEGVINKVHEYTAPSDTNAVDITGLDLDTDKYYKVLFAFYNPLGVNAYYRMFYNNDLVVTNYYMQYILSNGGTITSGRVNDCFVGLSPPGSGCSGMYNISRGPDGYPRSYGQEEYDVPSAVKQLNFSLIYSITGNVTSIHFRCPQGNGIGTGSKILIFGVSK